MDEIAPNVFVETGYALVTVGAVLTDWGWVCIDTPPYPRDARAWRDALREVSGKPVRYVINTDCHRDRILGNAWFEAPVVAHEASARQMHALKAAFISQAADELSTNDNELVEIASLPFVPPQVSFSNSMSLYCGGREIALLHRPGACFGTTWVILGAEKVLFAGDSVILDQHPIISEGATQAWLESLSELRRDHYTGWKVVPGRGAPLDPPATEPLFEYLRVARRRVGDLRRAGRPRSEVGNLVAELLPYFPYPARQRDEVQRRIRASLEIIYDEVRSREDGDAEEPE